MPEEENKEKQQPPTGEKNGSSLPRETSGPPARKSGSQDRGFRRDRRGRREEFEEEEEKALPEFTSVTGPGLKPDPLHGDMLAGKFINCMMWRGKKMTTQKIFYGAMEIIRKRAGEDPVKVFSTALENVMPVVEVKSRRVGGATYQVPVPVSAKRRLSLAIRWILAATRQRKGRPMAEKLADELLQAYNKEGVAMKKREDTHRMAEANKAFAHFAW